MTHNGHPHLPKLGYSERQLVVGVDCPRAKLHVERCACGADTVRPYSQAEMELMAREWGIRERVDEQVRSRVLVMTA